MPQFLITAVSKESIFVILFAFLLVYVLRENSNREKGYQDIIKDLSSRFEIVSDILDDVKEIKKKIFH